MKLPFMSNWEEILVPVGTDAAPTVDAVLVVRCKDCKQWDKYRGECEMLADRDREGGACFDKTTAADDFCSYGERLDKKDGDHT